MAETEKGHRLWLQGRQNYDLIDVVLVCGSCDDSQDLGAVPAIEDLLKAVDSHVSRETPRADSDQIEAPEPLLTAEEMAFMRLTADLANSLSNVIGHGGTRHFDLHEGVDKIHQLQHMVMAQAAARAYPGLFRVLGGVIDEEV